MVFSPQQMVSPKGEPPHQRPATVKRLPVSLQWRHFGLVPSVEQNEVGSFFEADVASGAVCGGGRRYGVARSN